MKRSFVKIGHSIREKICLIFFLLFLSFNSFKQKIKTEDNTLVVAKVGSIYN